MGPRGGIDGLDVLNTALIAAIAATGGLLLTAALRKSRPGLAHEVAGLAAWLVVLSPLLGVCGTRWLGILHAGGPPPIPQSRLAKSPVKTVAAIADPREDQTFGGTPAIGRTPSGPTSEPSVRRAETSAVGWIVAAWGLGSLIALGRAIRRERHALSVARRSRAIDDPRVLAALERAARALGLSPQPSLRESDETIAPLTLGPWRPSVLLPNRFAAGVSDAELEFVLRHELGHIAQGHHAASLAPRLATILGWWLPPTWWLGRLHAAIQEEIADEIAVNDSSASRQPYAELLVRLAEAANRTNKPVPFGLSIGVSPWSFRRRVLRLLEGDRRHMIRISRSARWALVLCGWTSAAGLAVLTVRAELQPPGPQQTEQIRPRHSVEVGQQASPPPQRGSFTTESFVKGQPIPIRAATIRREDGKPPRIEYPPSRTSSRFVTTSGGTRVAVAEGVEWQGKTAYLSLTFQVVVVEGQSDKALWSADVGAFWNTITFADVARPGEPARWALVLGSSRRPEFEKRFDLLTGRELETKGLPPTPAGLRLRPRGIWSGSAGIEKNPQYTLVGTAEAWTALREKLFGKARGIPDADAIDFAHEVLLVAYGGEQHNWNGIGVEEAFESEDRVLVRLHRSTYQSFGEIPPEHPYGLIVLPRRPGLPYILERNTQGLIGGPPLWKEQTRLTLPAP